MIKLFKEVQNKLTCITEQDGIFDKIEKNMWVHVFEPKMSDVVRLSEITGIDKDLLVSAMDEEESARLDVDDDYTMVVLDVPVFVDDIYETYPFVIIYNKDYYISLCKKETALLDLMIKKFKRIEPHKHVRMTLQFMYRIASQYIMSLKYLNSKRQELERAIQSSMKNKDLLSLMDLNKSFVYFSTSLNANKVVLGKVKRLEEYKKYESDFDLMEDVEVENNQAIEMCTIYRDILSGMIDANASIISNNLNTVMKVLAVITLIIEIPTLIASVFGMNVILPFASEQYGFYIIIAISSALAIVGGLLLHYMTSKPVKEKKRRK
jgi:magnesium transporter